MRSSGEMLRALVVGELGRDPGGLGALEGEPDLVVSVAEDVDDARRRVAEGPTPDVAVVVGGPRAPEAIRAIRSAGDGLRVLVVGGREDAGAVADAMSAGACGVLAGPDGASRLPDAVRRAAAGEIVLPEHLLVALVTRLDADRSRSAGGVLDRLTVREREILRALASGRTAAEVGADLGISALTVQTHVKSILAKLGVHSKIEAITLAWRHGLAPAPTSA